MYSAYSQKTPLLTKIDTDRILIGIDTINVGVSTEKFFNTIDTNLLKVETFNGSEMACGETIITDINGKVIESKPLSEFTLTVECIINWEVILKFEGKTREEIFLKEIEWLEKK